MVRLDLLLFRVSTPETYAIDSSKVNLLQGLGVLAASFTAGSLVAHLGLKATFAVSAGAFLLGALLYGSLFRRQLWRGRAAEVEPGAVDRERAAT
jgi:hypothetical protein